MRNKQKIKIWMATAGVILSGMFFGENHVWAAPEKQTEKTALMQM